MAINTTLLERGSSVDAERSSHLVRLGRGIRAVRSGLEMTRKALASSLGVTSKVLGYWERGETRPPIDKLIGLWRVLEVTPDELLAAGEVKTSTRRRRHGGPATSARRRTMSDETKVVLDADLKEAVPPTNPLVGTEDPDLKSERVQDE